MNGAREHSKMLHVELCYMIFKYHVLQVVRSGIIDNFHCDPKVVIIMHTVITKGIVVSIQQPLNN